MLLVSTRSTTEIVFLDVEWEADAISGPLHLLIIVKALLATAMASLPLHLFRRNAVVLHWRRARPVHHG
ncbi:MULTISPECIES: hypothetical protein [unclassified Streptomyces]|uniref:hypothetical protein n=1 Tax=unclassified Streptomyces TaxID=2593676 RepID=UPI002E815378|nr:hypothetical protein [Streptomyces sp. NBC_00589]WTI43001.1 hypothetical protein OIC96_46990 [Streptomyces sp. NBC_00775]WUB33371.1 hypothetical protein OHA51_02730 [Streptomyces sp. NBC_00589]